MQFIDRILDVTLAHLLIARERLAIRRTDDHREDEQVDLVDKVVVEQPPDKGAAAAHLQLTPPGLALSSPTAAATSLERTVVSAHRGLVSVVDATYLGREFNATARG